MTSVVIAAHDEAGVIGRCLTALQQQRPPRPLEVVVSANGCTDDTAALAHSFGVRVVDRSEAGKAAALNAGEDMVSSFPRIYLDADIVLAPQAIDRMTRALAQSPDAVVAIPGRRVDTAGCPIVVRSYFAINTRLPVFRTALFGRGTICLSERGRTRFDRFPAVIADDLFLDSLFTESERVVVPDVEIVVAAPRTSKDLLARLIRVRRGNAELRADRRSAGATLRTADRWAWWHSVVRPRLRLAPAAILYIAITLLAAALARRTAPANSWGRDESTRSTMEPGL